ncbi:MAG: CCDC90 family protein [Magnetococcus sp. YQC-5]
MTAIATTFDTLSYAKRFKAAGFTDNQAEEVVSALREVRDARLEELATKGDVKEAKAELEAKIADAKTEIIKWMFGVAAGQAVFILTILKMFPTR